MARKRKGGKHHARRRRLSGFGGKFNLINNVMAFGGGFAGGFITDTLDTSFSDMVGSDPMITPLVVEGVGLLTVVMGGEKLRPLGYGVQGAAGYQMYGETLGKSEIPPPPPPPPMGSINAIRKSYDRSKPNNY